MDKNELLLPDEVIMSKIYLLRGRKVMLDRDLAKLYGVQTKVLKQAVKRNIDRFPEDFMFEMTKDEFENWRSQFVTSGSDKIGLRYSPYCFTEQGVTMLSCILNSKRAIQLNIQIVRIFTKLREALSDSLAMKLEFEKIKKQLKEHDTNIQEIFTYLDELIKEQEKPGPRKRIGFRLPGKDRV